jgi:molybdopterin-binding protein
MAAMMLEAVGMTGGDRRGGKLGGIDHGRVVGAPRDADKKVEAPFATASRALSSRFPVQEDAIVKISARNQIKGTVVSVTPGAVNATIKVDIGGGNVITSSITNEAVQDLSLASGDGVTVIVKSSDVMIGK